MFYQMLTLVIALFLTGCTLHSMDTTRIALGGLEGDSFGDRVFQERMAARYRPPVNCYGNSNFISCY